MLQWTLSLPDNLNKGLNTPTSGASDYSSQTEWVQLLEA